MAQPKSPKPPEDRHQLAEWLLNRGVKAHMVTEVSAWREAHPFGKRIPHDLTHRLYELRDESGRRILTQEQLARMWRVSLQGVSVTLTRFAAGKKDTRLGDWRKDLPAKWGEHGYPGAARDSYIDRGIRATVLQQHGAADTTEARMADEFAKGLAAIRGGGVVRFRDGRYEVRNREDSDPPDAIWVPE